MGILQARILEWVAMPSSSGSSQLRHWTLVSCTGSWILCHWATGSPNPLFIYLSLAARGPSAVRWGLSPVEGMRAFPSCWYMGFSFRGLLLLPITGFRHTGLTSGVARAPEHMGFSSCGALEFQELWSSCSEVCEIFLNQGSNPCPLH